MQPIQQSVPMITVYFNLKFMFFFDSELMWLYYYYIMMQIVMLVYSYHVYLSKDVFILCKQQYSSPVVVLHDQAKCWEQQYQCQTISKVTFEATSVKQCGWCWCIRDLDDNTQCIIIIAIVVELVRSISLLLYLSTSRF